MGFPRLAQHCLTSLIEKGALPPEGGKAAEAFQSLFSHIDGKIRDGYGEDGCGRKVVSTEKLILTQYSPYLWYETYHDVMVWGNL
jgi:hypothetical protein